MERAPETRREDQVDAYHGTEVSDPYRWLEDPKTEETRAWVAAQNAHTQEVLGAVRSRASIHAALERAYAYDRQSCPELEAGSWWSFHNTGLEQQSRLVRQATLDGELEQVLDPNEFSEDGTRALFWWSPSPDRRWLTYGVSDGGSDWTEWRIRNLATGEDLDDVVTHTKFSMAPWLPDSSGFLYGRFPQPAKGVSPSKNQEVWFHRLGTAQAEDVRIYAAPETPDWGFWPRFTDDGAFVVLTIHVGTAKKNRVYLFEVTTEDGVSRIDPNPIELLDDFDAEYAFVGNEGRRFFFSTDSGADRGRIIAVSLDAPERAHWQDVVAEHDDTLVATSMVGGRLFCVYLHHAASRVRVHTLDGALEHELDLPGMGAVEGFHGSSEDTQVCYSFSSYIVPPTVYRYDIASRTSVVLRKAQVSVDVSDLHTEQVFVESEDGTQIPAFVSWRGELIRDSSRPTLLYGYGGFNVPVTPGFDPGTAVWLELGGVYVVANLRGGGEYGRDWHQAGTKTQKQNVFDDFASVARHLIDEGITRPERLAIHGRSNGGLLVGATLVQHPELFGAAIPSVGVLDLLRYHHWTVGWAWASDYGVPEDGREMFEALLAYSPVHNALPARYPPTLVTTGDHDDRVVPAHSYKFGAALQHAQQGDAPVLLRVETRAGHGMGKPISMAIDERADMWTFLTWALDMDH